MGTFVWLYSPRTNSPHHELFCCLLYPLGRCLRRPPNCDPNRQPRTPNWPPHPSCCSPTHLQHCCCPCPCCCSTPSSFPCPCCHTLCPSCTSPSCRPCCPHRCQRSPCCCCCTPICCSPCPCCRSCCHTLFSPCRSCRPCFQCPCDHC